MRTKITILGILSLLSLLFTNSVLAEGTTEQNSYNPVSLYEGFNFTATQNNEGHVEMTWNKYAPEGFNYYKIVRSTKNANPAYPEDGYIKYSSEKNFLSFTDKSVPSGEVYYRVCSIAKPDRYCSKVVTITNTANPTETTEVKEEPKTETITPAKINLTAEKVEGANKLSWTIDGSAPHGFKVAISYQNENPTYPVKEGDSYEYLSSPETRSYYHNIKEGKTYYYRVCQYNGGGECISYSNGVKVGESEVTKTTTETPQKETPFEDAKDSAYVNAIEYVRAEQIVSGYPDGTYQPEKTINRAEFTKIIIGAKFDKSMIDGCLAEAKDLFPDVPREEWFSKYICVAKNKGVIKGYEDGKFKPNNEISFTEAAKIINETFDLETGKEGSQWYTKYVLTLQKGNYIPPSISSLDKRINRAEMAEMIWRIKEGKTELTSKILIEG